jgi:hypothetical protein
VKSATRSASGRSAVKSRLTRSAGRAAVGSGVVVRHGLPRRLAPEPRRQHRRLAYRGTLVSVGVATRAGSAIEARSLWTRNPLAQAAAAHAYIESRKAFGRVTLTT